MTGSRIRGLMTVVMAGSVLVAGCGTRVDQQASQPTGAATGTISAAPEAAAAAPAETPAQSEAGIDTGGSASASGSAAPKAASVTPGGAQSTRPGAAPSSSPSAGSVSGKPAPVAATPGRPGSPGVPGAGTGSSGASGGSAAGVAPTPGGKSPLVIASLGTQSGPIGATLKPIVRGLQIWVADVNGRGGVNGHPVRVLLYDDGGDPARAKANAQDAIERKGAIALVANTDAISGGGSVDYVTEKRIPIIGGDHARTFNLKSQMFFP